jgi:sRNA-binding regulator protein Hfq
MRVEHHERSTSGFVRHESWLPMSSSSMLPVNRSENGSDGTGLQVRAKRNAPAPLPFRFPAQPAEGDFQNRHAELFYLQKQIQSQTPMVIVLEDGERIEGCIEWYDRSSLKVRGRSKMLIYKSAIKYMYKLGESGQF